MKHRSLIALALTIGGAGCYSPGLSDCVSACGAGGTCARDMTCSNGLCTRGPVCNVNEPPPPTSSCIESTRRCVSGQTQSCNGGKWAALATCADQTPACFAGGCVECPPGSARCHGPGAIQQCGPGGGWGPDLNCLGGAICQNGACVSTAGV